MTRLIVLLISLVPFFCRSADGVLKFQDVTLETYELPLAYQSKECVPVFNSVFKDAAYTRESMVCLQLCQLFLRYRLPAELIENIFSQCKKPFFPFCAHCDRRDLILNRGLPEFDTFKVISFEPRDGHPARDYTRFKIQLKDTIEGDNEAIQEQIIQTLINKSLVYSLQDIFWTRNENIVSIDCYEGFTVNRRGKLIWNDESYKMHVFIPETDAVTMHILNEETFQTKSLEWNNKAIQYQDFDPLNVQNHALFSVSFKGHSWDHYYTNDLLFVSVKTMNPFEQHRHHLHIYDVKNQKLIWVHKFDVIDPVNPRRFLDFADQAGYYLYNCDTQAITHYKKMLAFDIAGDVPRAISRLQSICKKYSKLLIGFGSLLVIWLVFCTLKSLAFAKQ